jgi:hypothetical protein
VEGEVGKTTGLTIMSKKQYNIDEIKLLAIIPGALKRNLRKGDTIYISVKDKNNIETLLTNDGVTYSSFDPAFEITMIVIV